LLGIRHRGCLATHAQSTLVATQAQAIALGAIPKALAIATLAIPTLASATVRIDRGLGPRRAATVQQATPFLGAVIAGPLPAMTAAFGSVPGSSALGANTCTFASSRASPLRPGATAFASPRPRTLGSHTFGTTLGTRIQAIPFGPDRFGMRGAVPLETVSDSAAT